MTREITKINLDKLVEQFETPDFIDKDPVQFLHRYRDKKDIEISGLISSAFAYGNRKKIVENLACIHKITNSNLYEFIINFDIDRDSRFFSGFCYRFTQERDILFLFHSIKQVIKDFGSLENAFMSGFSQEDESIRRGLTNFVSLLRSRIPCGEQCLKGFVHLLPSPENGSACKRLNLFLKWMVRKGPVDLNIWQEIPSSKLIIPLDTHVFRISKLWKLTNRKTADWKTAEEITEKLRQFDPEDPVKYDFAIFSTGITGVR